MFMLFYVRFDMVKTELDWRWMVKTDLAANSFMTQNDFKTCDMAIKGLKKQPIQLWDVAVLREWRVLGAKLATMNFSELYAWTKHLALVPRREKVSKIIEGIIANHKEITGVTLYEGNIWKSICKPPFRKQVTDFLWIALHGRTICGTFIYHWGGEWEEKAMCRHCGALESLQHILTECQNDWRLPVWKETLKVL